jgi:hypothetical protein
VNTILLTLAGIFNLIFAIFHLFFWRIFNWKNELPKLNFTNERVMPILNLVLIYIFFDMSAVCFILISEDEHLISKFLIGSFAGFWLFRTFLQVYYFSLRNKVSVSFTTTFLIGTLFHLLALIL